MIKPCLVPQNDRLNFSFVKDIYVVGEKMTKNGFKMPIYVTKNEQKWS